MNEMNEKIKTDFSSIAQLEKVKNHLVRTKYGDSYITEYKIKGKTYDIKETIKRFRCFSKEKNFFAKFNIEDKSWTFYSQKADRNVISILRSALSEYFNIDKINKQICAEKIHEEEKVEILTDKKGRKMIEEDRYEDAQDARDRSFEECGSEMMEDYFK